MNRKHDIANRPHYYVRVTVVLPSRIVFLALVTMHLVPEPYCRLIQLSFQTKPNYRKTSAVCC